MNKDPEELIAAQSPATTAEAASGDGVEVEHEYEDVDDDDMVSIPNDTYSMAFLSNFGGQAFWFALYVFLLKMGLYSLLAREIMDTPLPKDLSTDLQTAQALMLPVAVAMQDDLTTTFFLVSNVKFSPHLKQDSPHANRFKYKVSNIARGIDGLYSLLVNVALLIRADSMLALFLNFAALSFLQTIDNLALDMAANGYLTERLQTVAINVQEAKLPYLRSEAIQMMDSFLFIMTLGGVVVVWGMTRF